MQETRSRILIAALTIIMGTAFLVTTSVNGNVNNPDQDPTPIFVKIGRHYINPAFIRHVSFSDESAGLNIVFGPGAGEHVTLLGSEAKSMRDWLEEHSVTPHSVPQPPGGQQPQRPGQPQQKGSE